MTPEVALKLATDLLIRNDPKEVAVLLLQNDKMDTELHAPRNEVDAERLRKALAEARMAP